MAGIAKLAKMAGSKIALKSAGKISRRVGANGKIKRSVNKITNDLVKKNEKDLDKKASDAIKSANSGVNKKLRARGYRDVLNEKLRKEQNGIKSKSLGISESLKKINKTKNKLASAKVHELLGEAKEKASLNRFDKIADEIGSNNKKRARILSERRRRNESKKTFSRRKFGKGGKLCKKC